MNKTNDWGDGFEGPRRILCVRLDNFGDVLMTSPAFRALKQSWPNCHLTLLTSSAGAAVAPMIPEIDDVLVFDVPWVRANYAQESEQTNAGQVITMADTLRQYAFDAAIVFTVQSQNPLPA